MSRRNDSVTMRSGELLELCTKYGLGGCYIEKW